ncbi:hypothetical protein F5X97DRAFT_328672 [Nemania serpens]|nr:hypothetical protein F5X97DRAFT_328672 [Nemania serpens]
MNYLGMRQSHETIVLRTFANNTQGTTTSRYEAGGSCSDEDGDFDIAINHACNRDLRACKKVQDFFNDVKQLKTLEDLETFKWLSGFPLDMHDEVIPLFEDDASATGYQLHPCFTNLPLDSFATNPHAVIFALSIDGRRVPLNNSDLPQLVMGIGRLFTNADYGEQGRLSKWTGFEVFVDYELGLWMIFNSESRSHDNAGWYQLSSKLVASQDQSPQDREPTFGYAKFCDSLCRIASTSFEDARVLVEKTKTLGTVSVSQVEEDEINIRSVSSRK